MNHKDYILELAAKGKLDKAIEEFLKGAKAVGGSIYNDAISISGRYNGLKNDWDNGSMSEDFFSRKKNGIRNALTSMLEDYEPPAGISVPGNSGNGSNGGSTSTPVTETPGDTGGSNGKPKVFISYSHTNRDYAQKMKDALEAADIEVFIDEDRLAAGGDIKAFIREMINKTDATVSLVSTKALSSGWVGFETVMSLAHQEFRADKQFIPCSIDTDFFNDDFVIERMLYLKQKIDEIDAKIKTITEQLGAAAGSKHLNNKRDLMRELLNNFDSIIDRLNQSYTVDISDDNFDHGAGLVIKKLKGE